MEVVPFSCFTRSSDSSLIFSTSDFSSFLLFDDFTESFTEEEDGFGFWTEFVDEVEL